ncbi:Lipase (class 3) [Seminavis robusta]|uniref:Lipase (Class 3) n=1 Tax=Seminavis robusta TaxID=568900 RepID=A0A9N8E996_9STRA|nr:Lipase (class 3) [Seminavis robusta]|eukprot:Sro831_g208330.1 Lipase (class 3) (531) ;mRNA; f:15332-17016
MLENIICGSLVYAGSCDLKRRQPMLYRTGSVKNPFIAYDDGYHWPDLYTECDEMVETCVLVYLLAELRSLVRQGEATSKTEKVMQMPLEAKDLMRVINSSRALLTTSYSGCGELAANSTKFCLDLLRTADERFMRVKKRRKKERKLRLKQSSSSIPADDDEYGSGDSPTEGNDSLIKGKPIICPTLFISFDDDFKKEELFYAIGVNHERRRITMCFRGSVVSNIDWATDFDSHMREVKNPMKMHSSQQPTMKVHSKLYDLLYAEFSRNPQGEGGGGTGSSNNSTSHGRGGELWTVFMEILQNKIRPVTNNFPGYKLYITGHSFAGALATLFAFLAAAEPDAIIPKPVTCVSIASPYVGDESFRQAHQMLEGLGKLRHLRVSNHKDVVTASPKVSFRWRFYDSSANEDGGGHVGSLFKHVGMNLRLYQYVKPTHMEDGAIPSVPPPSYEISYPKVPFGFFLMNYFDEMARGWDQSPFANLSCNPVEYWTWPWHNIREYNKRLVKNKDSLQKISLNDLYSRKDIVGNLGSQF